MDSADCGRQIHKRNQYQITVQGHLRGSERRYWLANRCHQRHPLNLRFHLFVCIADSVDL
jgi:hypothetical protein